MTNAEQAAKIVSVHNSATDIAEASLSIGKPFLGAFGIAKTMGLPKGTLEYEVAVSAAYAVFRKAEIVTDNNGLIVELGGAQ